MGAFYSKVDGGIVFQSLSLTENMYAMLAQNPAARIRRLNTDRLQELGIRKHEAEAFARNFNYTPMQQAIFVETLEKMDEIQGREILLAHATAASDPDVARYMGLRAQMMDRFIKNHGAADIVSAGGSEWLRTRQGALVALLPLDYLAWTPEVERGVVEAIRNAAEIKHDSREVWMEGQVDPAARERLEAAGWAVKEGVALTPRNQPKT